MKDILEKIKKLLRMKRGGTPAEIETALALAAKLAAAHNIDLAGVNPDEEHQERSLSHTDALVASRLQWECKYAALVAQEFFGVSVLQRSVYRPHLKHALTFIGTSADTVIAIHVYHFLVGHFRREWRRCERRNRLRNRRAFLYAIFRGLSAKLREARKNVESAQTPGLVLANREIERRQSYMDRVFGATTEESARPSSMPEAASILGWIAGQNTSIHPVVTATQTRLALPG